MRLPTIGWNPGDRAIHRTKTYEGGPLKGTVIQVTKTSLRVVWDGNWNMTTFVRKKSVCKSLNIPRLKKKIAKVRAKLNL